MILVQNEIMNKSSLVSLFWCNSFFQFICYHNFDFQSFPLLEAQVGSSRRTSSRTTDRRLFRWISRRIHSQWKFRLWKLAKKTTRSAVFRWENIIFFIYLVGGTFCVFWYEYSTFLGYISLNCFFTLYQIEKYFSKKKTVFLMNLQFFSTVSSDVKEAITNEWVAGTLCEWKQLYNSIMWFIRETWINYYLTVHNRKQSFDWWLFE